MFARQDTHKLQHQTGEAPNSYPTPSVLCPEAQQPQSNPSKAFQDRDSTPSHSQKQQFEEHQSNDIIKIWLPSHRSPDQIKINFCSDSKSTNTSSPSQSKTIPLPQRPSQANPSKTQMNLKNQRSSQKVPRDHHSSAQESPFDEKYLKQPVLTSSSEKYDSQEDTKEIILAVTSSNSDIVQDSRIANAIASVSQSLFQADSMQVVATKDAPLQVSQADSMLETSTAHDLMSQQLLPQQARSPTTTSSKASGNKSAEMKKTKSSTKRTNGEASNLRCTEQLNPEEEQREQEETDSSQTAVAGAGACSSSSQTAQSESTQKPLLKLCLNLPSSRKAPTAISTITSNANSKSKSGESNLLKDASRGFSASNHLGLPYLASQRQLRNPADPNSVKTKQLLQLPNYFIVGTERIEGLNEAREKHAVVKTRHYLQGDNFSHVFKLRPVFSNRVEAPLVTVTAPPATVVQAPISQVTQVQASAPPQQQTQQIAQRRHLLSKRTRVSAQSSCGHDYDPNGCLVTDSSHQIMEKGSSPSLKRFKSDAVAVAVAAPQATIENSATGEATQQSARPAPRLQTQFSTVSTSCSATVDSELSFGFKPRASSLLTTADSTATMLGPSYHNKAPEVIENDSKEVLLRMFEYLIEKEQSQLQQQQHQQGGSKSMRDRKAARKTNKGKKVLRRNNGSGRGGASSLADEGIKASSNQAATAALLSQASLNSSCSEAPSPMGATNTITAHEEVVTIGRDGVYRIQFGLTDLESTSVQQQPQ